MITENVVPETEPVVAAVTETREPDVAAVSETPVETAASSSAGSGEPRECRRGGRERARLRDRGARAQPALRDRALAAVRIERPETAISGRTLIRHLRAVQTSQFHHRAFFAFIFGARIDNRVDRRRRSAVFIRSADFARFVNIK